LGTQAAGMTDDNVERLVVVAAKLRTKENFETL
jgi:hypothetical protein